MNDQHSEHSSAPPPPAGPFDWLVESHRQSSPLAPLSDELPPPRASTGAAGFPEAQAPPSPIVVPESAFSAPFLPRPTTVPDSVPVAPVFGGERLTPPFAAEPEPPAPPPTMLSEAPPPVAASSFPLRFTDTPDESATPAPPAAATQQQAWTAPPPQAAAPAQQFGAAPAFSAPAAPTTTFVPTAGEPAVDDRAFGDPITGGGGFGLERRPLRPRSANGPLDWAAIVLAILAPPVGLLLGIGAALTEPRSKGFVTGLAKAAIAVGAALSLVLGVAFAVYTKVSHDQADHNAIVASSKAWCASLKSNPSVLASDTFGWPSPADTIPDSITTMKQYETHWQSLVALAPPGIRSDTRKIATAAQSIVASVESTQTLDDSSDVAEMQNAVATTGITAWANEYCS